jgi:spermidine synthase
VKPWIHLGRAPVPGGGELTLHQRDREFVLRVDGAELMSTRRHGSEDALAELGCAGLGAAPAILIGGLGFGFTLRAALAVAPAQARIVVGELVGALVEWNRALLGPEAAAALADPRVAVEVGDVGAQIRGATGRWDAILLDVDNSPHALAHPGNGALYSPTGLAAARRALRPGGVLAVWSAVRAPAFGRRMVAAGFAVDPHDVPARAGTGATHTIYVGRAPRQAPAPG